MNKCTKEIMDLLKKNFEQVVGQKKFQGGSKEREYYLFALADNLYKPMGKKALFEYGQGSGNEIFSGKMNALRSSSALTYNLFGNNHSKINGKEYTVEFEKQYHTLKTSVSNRPANLDAFLYCKETGEAIACEMKMMEWICNKPGKLKKAYLNPENYINKEIGEEFVKKARALIEEEYRDADLEEYPCKMKVYDAFQMFKHAVACYTACAQEEKRDIKKLTLLNCVWTLPNADKLKIEQNSKDYKEREKREHKEFEEFKSIMMPEGKLFDKKEFEFDIQFYTFKDFLALLDKSENELNYLKRYTF